VCFDQNKVFRAENQVCPDRPFGSTSIKLNVLRLYGVRVWGKSVAATATAAAAAAAAANKN